MLAVALRKPALLLLELGAIPGMIHIIRWIYAWFMKPTSITFELGTATLSFGELCGRGKAPVLLSSTDIGKIRIIYVQRAAGRGQLVGKFRLNFSEVADVSSPISRLQLEIARISSMNTVKENKRIVNKLISQLESLAVMFDDPTSSEALPANATLEIENFTSFDDLPKLFNRSNRHFSAV